MFEESSLNYSFRTHGPPTLAGQRLCGFDKGRSLVAKSRVKRLANPCVAKLNKLVLT